MGVLHGTWDGENFYTWLENENDGELGSLKDVDVLIQELEAVPTTIEVAFPSKDGKPALYPYSSAREISQFKIQAMKIPNRHLLRFLVERYDFPYSNSMNYWRHVLLVVLTLIKWRRGFYPRFEDRIHWEIEENLLHEITKIAPVDSMPYSSWSSKEGRKEIVKSFVDAVMDSLANLSLSPDDLRVLSSYSLSSSSRYTLYFLATPEEEGWRVTFGLYDLQRNAMIPYDFSVLKAEFHEMLHRVMRYPEVRNNIYYNTPFVVDHESAKMVMRALSYLSKKGYKVFVRTKARVKPVIRTSGLNLLTKEEIESFDYRIALGDHELSPEEFERLVRENRPYLELGGKLIEISTKDLERVERILDRIKKGELSRTELVREALSGYVEGEHIKGLVEKLEDKKFSVLEPPNLNVKLRPYQVKGFSWMRFMTSLGFGVCLADDMGLGKTIQTIATIAKAKEEGEEVSPSLVVCPTSVLRNWEEEIGRYAPSLTFTVIHGKEKGSVNGEKVDVYITTYNTLLMREELLRVNWKFLVLDEAQNIKNSDTRRSRLIRQLKGEYRIALTGTPIENSVNDLWSIMNFLNPGLLGSRNEFEERFAKPIRGGDQEAKETLRRLIAPFILRRTKNDESVALDLPDKIEMSEYCNLTEEQVALYRAIVDDFLTRVDKLSGMKRRSSILATITKLKEVVDHPALVKGDRDYSPVRSGKLKRALDVVEEAVKEGDRVAIFTQFVEMGEILKLALEMGDYNPLFFHGGLSREERDRLLNEFNANSDRKVIIMSLRAGGVGINLTSANRVIHYDRWWNPAVENQATDRTHRIGQTKKVIVHKMISLGTIEEKIDEVIKTKEQVYREFIRGNEEVLTELSTEELRRILELR
ncbi:DEAD/DEAH box helicase [Metallosphaera javensis (ex Sakai et al. 2022)]|uniref:DEAD/DEAH box helicase n=1 Tax=Metallosphaera javensis (ex Sakai et al. 2022) TaxID=2775498 RepID=UPI002582A903|nr:MAG: RNA polymerase-associated protein RapA [Metallosphaera javensis (ex Sakai et al. 2022)]